MKNLKTIIAIGGGEIGDLETLSIDRAIVRFAKKKKPMVLFIPTASGDASGYWKTFQKVYGEKLGCETDVLFLIREKFSKKEIEKKIFSADIIYVGGGNTLMMMRVWRKLGVDKILCVAYEKGIILAGLSAGAICWFRYGLSDTGRFSGKPGQFTRVSGLNLLPFTISPHHIREKKHREKGLKQLMARTPGIALALDDNSAIVFQGERYKILNSRKGVGARRVFVRKGRICVTSIEERGIIQDLIIK